MKVSQHYIAKRSCTLPAFSLQPQESVCCVHDEIIPLIKLACCFASMEATLVYKEIIPSMVILVNLERIMVIMLLVCDRLDKIPLVCKLK